MLLLGFSTVTLNTGRHISLTPRIRPGTIKTPLRILLLFLRDRKGGSPGDGVESIKTITWPVKSHHHWRPSCPALSLTPVKGVETPIARIECRMCRREAGLEQIVQVGSFLNPQWRFASYGRILKAALIVKITLASMAYTSLKMCLLLYI